MDAPPNTTLLSPTTGLTSFLKTVLNTTLPQATEVAIAPNQPESTSWLEFMGHGIFVMAKAVPGTLVWIITFITITLPTVLFALFSTSLTFTMNFTTLYVITVEVTPSSSLILRRLLIALAFASLVSWIVRYRFLDMYARLPPEPQRKEPQIDLFPEAQDGDSKRGLANYFDEFLSAIKVFGYRE